MSAEPSRSILLAFGATGHPVPLEGGEGLAWLVGDAVLKPLDLDGETLAWQGDVLDSIRASASASLVLGALETDRLWSMVGAHGSASRATTKVVVGPTSSP